MVSDYMDYLVNIKTKDFYIENYYSPIDWGLLWLTKRKFL